MRRPIIGSLRDVAIPDKVGGGAFNPALDQAAMDALDDVAALAERAQDALDFLADHPLAGAERRGEAKLFELARAADQHRSLDIVLLTRVRPKVARGHPASPLPRASA